MFSNEQVFVIHPKHTPCSRKEIASPDNTIQQNITDLLQNTYSKQKLLPLVFKLIVKKNLIDDNLFFIQFNIHVADFISFINNRFGKINTTEGRFLKLAKHLQTLQLKLPKAAVKNPVAAKFLCA